jgi:hypothetical protein
MQELKAQGLEPTSRDYISYLYLACGLGVSELKDYLIEHTKLKVNGANLKKLMVEYHIPQRDISEGRRLEIERKRIKKRIPEQKDDCQVPTFPVQKV